MSVPALRALKEWNNACTLIAFSNRSVRDFLLKTGLVDRIIPDPGRGFLGFWDALRLVRRERFDLALDFTSDYTLRTAFLAFLSKSICTVGFDTNGRGFLFSKLVRAAGPSLHKTDELSAIVQSIGMTVNSRIPMVVRPPEVYEDGEAFLQKENITGNDVVIGLQPSGYYYTQRWPERSFAALADLLSPSAKIVLLESAADGERTNEIRKMMRSRPIVYRSDSIISLMFILRRCRVFVCNNSGTLHLAAALGVSTVSTMGPTIPERWWPLGENNIVVRKSLPCMPCNSGVCRIRTHDCMNQITVTEVLEAVARALEFR